MNTFIIDVSSWNADKVGETYTVKTNPQQLIDAGCVGAIIRLSSGNWVDPAAVQFVEQLAPTGISLAGYCYDKPTVTSAQVAETFVGQVQRFGGLAMFKMGLYCDAPEIADVGTAYIEHPLKTIELVCDALQPDLKKVGIYTNKNFWKSNGGEGMTFAYRAQKYQLWCALWNNMPGVIPEIYHPKPWYPSWLFHQYSADNNRMARQIGVLSGDPDIDLSIFNPMLGKIESYFGTVKPQPEPAPVSGDLDALAAQVAGIELRLSGLESWARELEYRQ